MGVDDRGPAGRRPTLRCPRAASLAAGLWLAVATVVASCAGSTANDATVATTTVATTTVATTGAPGPDEAVGDAGTFVDDVLAAIDAVEAELGPNQRFFEVTANVQFTNVFVAEDDATAAVAYAYIDGDLQPPAPKQTGAEGSTFERSDVAFDPDLVLSGVETELSESVVDAVSVYGDGVGATYVLAVTSPEGGFLDVVVGPQGQILSVDPI